MVSAAQESALSTQLGAMACPHEPRAAGQRYEAASEPFEAMIRSKAAVGNANREGRSPAYERLHWVSLAREHVSHVVARRVQAPVHPAAEHRGARGHRHEAVEVQRVLQHEPHLAAGSGDAM